MNILDDIDNFAAKEEARIASMLKSEPVAPSTIPPTPLETPNPAITEGFTPPATVDNPRIRIWAQAIQTREGGQPNDPNIINNNPGDIKATKYGLSLGATSGVSAADFCIYTTYEVGFNALCQLLCDAVNGELIGLKPAMSILTFTQVYAEPPNDEYAIAVAAALGVNISTTVYDAIFPVDKNV